MKKIYAAGIVATMLIAYAAFPKPVASPETEEPPSVSVIEKQKTKQEVVEEYLRARNSPLADHAAVLLEQEHWELLIAISRIESQYCTRKIAFNCWGIGGDSAYKRYASYDEAIRDAEALITKWQDKGRWLSVEDMNCSYVVPCSANWEAVVKAELKSVMRINYDEIKK